jgi:hypothetical protein
VPAGKLVDAILFLPQPASGNFNELAGAALIESTTGGLKERWLVDRH